ncbi:UNVERIFIED_CONTAM: hypothetical protein Sangu_1169500 [Sesamum angustifolium]|uniref:Reverse transcriptase zinc-binding domain-containing protein n=1 Tax=Sesamum angustifolium TaxID=2727405 RepID=A0AAW2P0L8_9LAMI
MRIETKFIGSLGSGFVRVNWWADLFFRVGSGSRISVWTDPWIPRPRSFKLITPVPPALAHLSVADLIDRAAGWRVDLVKTIFWPYDSACILAIPLNRLGDINQLIWHYTKYEAFSVRSACHLACSFEKPCTSSRFDEEASWWRKMWQAKLPNRVKIFVWRACSVANFLARSASCSIEVVSVVSP